MSALIDRKNSFFHQVQLVDQDGKPLKDIMSWNSGTETAEVYLRVDDRFMTMRLPTEPGYECSAGVVYKEVRLP